MTDLTKITTPFGMLDRLTQEALRTHRGQIEMFEGDTWEEVDPSWSNRLTYRVKPTPPKPREWWLRLNAAGAISGTDLALGDPPPNWDKARTIKVREVLG